MQSITQPLDELAAWGVDLDLIRFNAAWSPLHRLEVMEGIIQVGMQARQQTLDPRTHRNVLRLHFASPLPLFHALYEAQIHAIYSGRLAAVLQGVPGISYTIDLCYARDDDNIARLLQALRPFAIDRFPTTEQMISEDPYCLDSTCAELRLFVQIPGVGDFEAAKEHSQILDLDHIPLQVLDLTMIVKSMSIAPEAGDAFFLPWAEATQLMHQRET